MRPLILLALLAGACSDPSYEPVDLTQPVPTGSVRAGVITDPSVLWGGISAEGQLGDALLVNDRARFVVQSERVGSFYFTQGGGLLDADIVRPAGVPGRDMVEEWREVVGTTRINDVQRMTVLDSGVGSDAARVVTTGTDVGIDLISGVLETDELFQPLGLTITTEYRLPADSWFLEVTTTVIATEDIARFDVGDILIIGTEVSDRWRPEAGIDVRQNGPSDFLAAIAHQNDVAVMVATVDGEVLGEPLPILSELGDIDLGVGYVGPLSAGETLRYTRLYGVGPDLATLTDELLVRRGVSTQDVSGTVIAGAGPLAQARVVLFVDGEPWSVAVTDAEGNWAATAPADADVTWRAVGRNTGYFGGLPGMTGHHSPFVTQEAGSAWLDALRDPAPGAPDGYGVATPADPLTLLDPATITVRSDDVSSFEVRATRSEDDAVDSRFVPARPQGGATATAWARQGEITFTVEPGTYELLMHKGVRFEQDRQTITVTSGESVDLTASLPAAYDHPGWLMGDPHQHASPSNDGNVSMEERLLVNAARGIQLPFGTDHDRLTDYNVLIEPLGLQDELRSVIANEVSSVRRGHMNAYPVILRPEMPNNGAYLWYVDVPVTTEDYVAKARAAYPGAFLQWNHPFSSGVAAAADYSLGRIGNTDFWSDDVDVIEVLNDGDYNRAVGLYLDLVNRGYAVSATGASDAHGRTNSGIGFNATFVYMGTDDVADYTDEGLVAALDGGATVVSMGPFLDLSVRPGSRIVGSGTTLTVVALHPTWMDVDQLELYRDGMLIDTVLGTEATFDLDATIDASYVVMARGDEPMELYDRAPWAMSGAIFVDVDGNGWEPPLPPLERN